MYSRKIPIVWWEVRVVTKADGSERGRLVGLDNENNEYEFKYYEGDDLVHLHIVQTTARALCSNCNRHQVVDDNSAILEIPCNYCGCKTLAAPISKSYEK